MLQTELACDAQGVSELRLACSELSKHLRDAAGFDAAAQQLVQLLGPRCEMNDLRSLLVVLRGGGESERDELGRLRHQLERLRLRDALHRQQRLERRVRDTLHSVVASLHGHTNRQQQHNTTTAGR